MTDKLRIFTVSKKCICCLTSSFCSFTEPISKLCHDENLAEKFGLSLTGEK